MGLFIVFLEIARLTGFLAYLHALHMSVVWGFWQWLSLGMPGTGLLN